MRSRTKQAAAVVGLVAVVAVVLVLVLNNGGSPSGNAAEGHTYTGTTTVARRNLIATDTESGTLGYASSQTVYNRLSGTITWVPAAGQVIRPGQTLFDVDNSPVMLMDGPTPAYRNLDPSDTDGPDILELNRSLVDLGYDPDGIEIDDQWQAATTAGVEELQKAQGWAENGTLTLGQIVFLPGNQLVNTVDATAGSTGGGSATSFDQPQSQDEFVDFSRDTGTTTGTTTAPTNTGATSTDTTTSGTTTTTAQTGTSTSGQSSDSAAVAKQLAALRAQLAALKKQLKSIGANSKPAASNKPASSDKGNGGNSNPGGGSATAIMQTTSTQLVVTVDLSASLQSEATLGENVTVEMPDGSTVGGKVSAVSSVAASSDSGGDSGSSPGGSGDGDSGSSSSTVPVTVTLDKRAKGAGLDQAAVSVNFTQSKANNVLSVPVTALIATSGQNFAVQEATASYKLLPVTTGLFAAGYVQISGSGVYSGLQVSDSQG